MAYFIVIGTNNEVKDVVDEIKRSHLQHNVITSGCILREGENMYYHWDVYNEKGDKTDENQESIKLQDALTNQISHFKTLLPNDAIPNVFIISQCFDDEESSTLQMVCEELHQIRGAKMCGLQVDIVLLGYDLNKVGDVTIRPHWRILESLRGLEVTSRFHTNILYINNMDYSGAATNVDSHVLGKFLCHWSKMVCAGGYDPKATVRSNVYSIGMSEHQYDFRDLNEFFKLSAEEKLLDRKLNHEPSSDTKELLDYNYYKKIDLDFYWIDGLCSIQSEWDSYCSTEWDSSKPLSSNSYSVSLHEQELASYLNSFLRLYVVEENREIDKLKAGIEKKEQEIAGLSEGLATNEETVEQSEAISIKERVQQLQLEIDESLGQIKIHEENIDKNTFLDADEFYQNYGAAERITEEDEIDYSSNYAVVRRMIDYVKSDEGINIMREAIDRATVNDKLPQPYPALAVLNMGRVNQRELPAEGVYTLPTTTKETFVSENLSERPGCLMWFKNLFGKRSHDAATIASEETFLSESVTPISDEASKFLSETLNKSVAGLKKADDIRLWWKTLCELVENYKRRKKECELLMDGESEGYCPKWHRKSISLIDMEKVRLFRDTNAYYKENIDKFLCRWFDKNIDSNQRMTMHELIKHQVLDALVGRYHTLKWDGSNPFVKEDITDKEMHEYIEHDIRQSKPFVEYVRVQESNIVSNVNIGFFSNNPNVPVEPTVFRRQYSISMDSINPVFLEDFVNSLCVIQVMDVPDHIDALKDFKPRREAELSKFRLDIKDKVASIIGNANTIEDKAKAIYDWICDNIVYDTTKQIYDAETCLKTGRGVCQAYSELFCYMAESVGLVVDIIAGKTKKADGGISEDKHAWVFVYTHAYDGILVDPTWGAGSVDGSRFVKSNDNSRWFNVSPYWMIFSHFPDKEHWAKLDIKITEDQFKNLPYLLPEKGIDGKDALFEGISKIQ